MAWNTYKHKVVKASAETDRRHSWYWTVLKKNYGTMKKAEVAVFESRKRADLYLDMGIRIKI